MNHDLAVLCILHTIIVTVALVIVFDSISITKVLKFHTVLWVFCITVMILGHFIAEKIT